MWINSLNIDGLYINDLFGDLTDGVAILKIMDKVRSCGNRPITSRCFRSNSSLSLLVACLRSSPES